MLGSQLQHSRHGRCRRALYRGAPGNPFNINNVTQDEINQKLQTQLLAGVSDGLPDIVLIQDDNIQRFLQSFPGSFVPLSDHIDMSKFASYKVAAATHEGKSYSLPSTLASPGSSTAPTIWKRPATRPKTSRTSPGTG